jgi:hypothetical protein
MRFCMITTFYPPYNFGGDGVLVQRLSTELARRGHRVDVIHIDSYRLAAPLPTDGYRDHPNVIVHGVQSGWGALSPLATQQSGLPVVGGPKILEYGDAVKLYTLHD